MMMMLLLLTTMMTMVNVLFFDHYQVLSYLDTLDGVVDVRLRTQRGITRHEVMVWEKVSQVIARHS